MAENEWLSKDFYKTLGVSQDATHDDISKAYRKLARKYHPDLNHDPGATEKFKDISEAYDVLSNKDQRRKYDAIRSFGAGGARFTGGSSANGFSAGDFSDLFGSMFGDGDRTNVRFSTSSGSGAFSDIFSQFAGGQAGFGGYSAPRPQAGEDLHSAVTLTFRQAVKGATVSLRVGGSSFKTHVPAGVRDGQTIKIPGKGRAGTGGGANGDLYLKLTVKPDDVFSIEGVNLVRPLPLTVAEAALGGTVEVTDFDGTLLKVKVPAGTSGGTKLRVRKRGVATSSTTGDLLLRVEVRLPKHPSTAAKKALRAFDEATGDFAREIQEERAATD
ncbi:MAG: DnaJ domain-containing protein [Aeriscardovia sp.]|nr:DnaJ domain-containing protein [Aeriscardovia sp.]MBQ9681355.1 DnaJ domain-containing protein [Aeriscardovia sp.]